MRRMAAGILLVLAVGCGGDSTGPSSTPEATIAGQWVGKIWQLNGVDQGQAVQCHFDQVVLTLTQSGKTFSGTHAGGVLTCQAGPSSATDTFGAGSVTAGTITDQDVVFIIGGIQMVGTWNGDVLSGTSNAVLDGIPFSGPFRFER